jgi:hypothetical protein
LSGGNIHTSQLYRLDVAPRMERKGIADAAARPPRGAGRMGL